MKFSLAPLAGVLAGVQLAAASPVIPVPTHQKSPGAAFCHKLRVPVNVTSRNIDFSTLPGIENPASLLKSTTLLSFIESAALSKNVVHGNEVFAGTYCEPKKKIGKRHKTLQILVHGITYTRDYWQANPYHFEPHKYSWVEYALKQGYPTFALDRIGNGMSTHPDPVQKLQMPYEVRAHNELYKKIRKGQVPGIPRAFKTLIHVGHSYGSVLGNNLASDFPEAVDAFVLTGFSSSLLKSFPGIAQVNPAPAQTYDPERFGHLPPGYVVTKSKKNRRTSFYWKPGERYEPSQYETDYSTMGTVGFAEVVTVFTDITEAPRYKGKVYVLTGNQDQPFCGFGNPNIGPVGCGTGPGSYLAKTRKLFPGAKAYGYFAIPQTGHCLNFHYSAPTAYKKTHDWLAKEGF